MTNQQLLEADEIFSATLSPEHREKLEKCFLDLCKVAHKHGPDIYRDCMLQLNAKFIRDAEAMAEKEQPKSVMWVFVSDPGES